jgi:DNA-binding response OmpR family regulator
LTDKIEALDCGADEYIVKPYSSPELISKINALIRRYSYGKDLQKEHEYTYQNISLNEWTREVKVSGRRVKLTRKEYQFLLTLIKAPNYPVSRDKLFDILWNYDGYRSTSDEANLNTHASSLRRKIKLVDPHAAKLIVTEKCYGYKLGVC